jgi:hypothetical protein
MDHLSNMLEEGQVVFLIHQQLHQQLQIQAMMALELVHQILLK